MGSLSSFKCVFQYLLCVIHVYTIYAWVKPSKDKKAKTVFHSFIEIVKKAIRKPNMLWFDQGKELHNNLMQKKSHDNDILMYTWHIKKVSSGWKVYKNNEG